MLYHVFQTVSQFLCAVEHHSASPPTSVHSLRPGDIKVVGAMGDSLTTAVGAGATTIVQELTENRGLSWSGGGQGTLEEHTITMPNILKKYNSKLWGYATGNTHGPDHVRAHLNVAVSGSTSSDLAQQASMLVDRLKNDPEVDFVNDWKVITILIGNNDLCDSCTKPDDYNEAQFYMNLVRALDVLHSELPRTLVNLVEPLNMGTITQLNKGLVCSALHYLVCECAAFPKSKKAEKELVRLTGKFQKTVEEIATSRRYDTRQDFTVVHQPLFNSTSVPMVDGKPDLSYFAPDCIHLSDKGQAAAALTLWNNMITPQQDKEPLRWPPTGTVKCTSEDQPYIYTNLNSNPLTPSAEPSTDNNFFPRELMIATTVCGVVVVVVGAAVLVGVARRVKARRLYVQIPQ
ncbi:hypothetical protein V1264_019185 [Littorina saxatilis]|uniref:Phospholipase B1, membrane-associated n=1 Tax=Littorina saxatilis TaxID=31220 RepID=A0AAN9GDQ7_9CAEN